MIYLYKKYKAKKAASNVAQEQQIPEHEKDSSQTNEVKIGDNKLKSEPEISGERPGASKVAQNPISTESAEEKRRRRIYRWKLVLSLFPPAFLAAIDTTIVATALTTIASHFNQLNQFNWVVTAYTLTSTAFIPAYGQVADTFGRHFALQTSMVFMLIGSILCATAPDWGVFLLGRALQGLSAAGIMNIIKIILADNVTLAEQSKNSTIFAFVNGISYAVGPVIGGSLANSNWRYCFVVSIPITVISQVLIFFVLRKELVHGTHHLTGPERKSFLSGLATIDIGGTVLFIFGAGLIILGTSWGGGKYAWDSRQVLVPLVIGSVLFMLFFLYEYLLEPGKIINRVFPKQVAMIPWKLFERRDVISLCVINAATGAALYSAFYFVGIFWTLVQGYDPAKAGYQLLYYTPGIGVGVYSAMFMCNFFPRQTFFPIFIGCIVEATGFSVLAWATSTRKSALVSVMMAISGAGTGLRFMPNTLHAAGVWPTRLASVMSLMDFTLPFGGTLAIAIMSAVFYNKFAQSLNSLGGVVGQTVGGVSAHNKTQSLQGINSLPPEIQNIVREKAARAVMWSFISVLPVMGLSILAATVLGNVWIRPKSNNGEESHAAIIYSSYLLAAFTGKLKTRKVPVDSIDPVLETEASKETNEREVKT